MGEGGLNSAKIRTAYFGLVVKLYFVYSKGFIRNKEHGCEYVALEAHEWPAMDVNVTREFGRSSAEADRNNKQ